MAIAKIATIAKTGFVPACDACAQKDGGLGNVGVSRSVAAASKQQLQPRKPQATVKANFGSLGNFGNFGNFSLSPSVTKEKDQIDSGPFNAALADPVR